MSSNPKKRYGKEGKKYSYNKEFWEDIVNFGWNEGFTHEIIEELFDKDTALEREKYWTLFYKSNTEGYNKNVGCKASAKSKEKMSEAHIGKHLSNETKRKISASQKGKVLSEDHKKKISASRKGILVGDKHPNSKKLVDVKTGKEYSCLGYCAEDLGINYDTLRIGISRNYKKYQHLHYV